MNLVSSKLCVENIYFQLVLDKTTFHFSQPGQTLKFLAFHVNPQKKIFFWIIYRGERGGMGPEVGVEPTAAAVRTEPLCMGRTPHQASFPGAPEEPIFNKTSFGSYLTNKKKTVKPMTSL